MIWTRILLTLSITTIFVWIFESYIHAQQPEIEQPKQLGANEQFKLLLKYRPQLLQIIKPNDEIWNWLNQHFSSTLGRQVFFHAGKKYYHAGAQATSFTDIYGNLVLGVRRIDLNTSQPMDPEKILSCVVFEFYNLEHSNDWCHLTVNAYRQTITASQYVDGAATIELQVSRQTQSFFDTIYFPYAMRNKMNCQPNLWVEHAKDEKEYISDRLGYVDGYMESYNGIISTKNPKCFLFELNPKSGRVEPVKVDVNQK